MSNLVSRDRSPIAADKAIERDIATAYAALLKQPSGSLIAATLVHAPEDIIARIQARDTHYLTNAHYYYLKMCRGSFDEQSQSLKSYPRAHGDATFFATVLVPGLGTPVAVAASLGAWHTVGAWPLVGLIGLTGLLATFCGLWMRRDPLRLTRAQQSALMTPVSEGGWSVSATDITNQKSLASPASGLAVLARAEVAEIRSSAAWLDPTMDDNWIRLDLDRELAEITSAARTLSQMRDRAVALTKNDVGEPLVEQTQQWRQTYETLYASIIGRLAALQRYRDSLTAVSALLTDQAAVREIQVTSQEINDGLVHIALCDAAVNQLDTKSIELTDVKENLVAQNDFLGVSSR